MKDSIDRIAVALERIAVALEKANEPVVVTQETPASFEPSRLHNEDLRVYSDPSKTDMAWNKLRYDPVKDLWIDTQKSDDTDIHVWTGPTAEDDKNAETCRNKFACAIDFTKDPVDDRFLTREEAHILNSAIKRSTIKAHGGKLSNDKKGDK